MTYRSVGSIREYTESLSFSPLSGNHAGRRVHSALEGMPDMGKLEMSETMYTKTVYFYDIILDGEFIDRIHSSSEMSEKQIYDELIENGYNPRLKLIGPY